MQLCPHQIHSDVYIVPVFASQFVPEFSSFYIFRMMFTINTHQGKISSFLQLFKDNLALKTSDIYSISCECGKVYTGQIDHSVEIRIK
jgi:hypothetical protein